MELNFYVLTFDNHKEYLIESKLSDAEAVLERTYESVLKLQRGDGHPLIIGKGKLFSVHRMDKNAVSPTSKTWRLL